MLLQSIYNAGHILRSNPIPIFNITIDTTTAVAVVLPRRDGNVRQWRRRRRRCPLVILVLVHRGDLHQIRRTCQWKIARWTKKGCASYCVVADHHDGATSSANGRRAHGTEAEERQSLIQYKARRTVETNKAGAPTWVPIIIKKVKRCYRWRWRRKLRSQDEPRKRFIA